jgi:hypothetical protein
MPVIKTLPFEPKPNQVYARMGFKPWKAEIPSGMMPLVDQAIELGRRLIEPQGCWECHTISTSRIEGIQTDQGLSVNSQKVAVWMEDCHALYLTAITLGTRLDHQVADLSANGQMTLGFLLNAYGAEAAEALMESMDRHLKNLARRDGWITTKRYSPGYGDWEIRAQEPLLRLIRADQIGINLTDSYLMVPEKSVSAIIGVKKA